MANLPAHQTHLGKLSQREGAIALYSPNKHASTAGGLIHGVLNSGVRLGTTVVPYSLMGLGGLLAVSMKQNAVLKAKLAKKKKRRSTTKVVAKRRTKKRAPVARASAKRKPAAKKTKAAKSRKKKPSKRRFNFGR